MVFISLMTGHMTKIDRNRASPASTWLGGMEGSESALRVMASTTKILVNEVIISSSAGATDSRVIPIRVRTALEGFPSMPLMAMLTLPVSGLAGALGVAGGVGGTGAAWPVAALSHSSRMARRTAARPIASIFWTRSTTAGAALTGAAAARKVGRRPAKRAGRTRAKQE